MGNLITALTIVLSINVILWMSQIAILEINPTGTQYFNYEGSMISDYDSTGNYTLNTQNPAQLLPKTDSSVGETIVNFFLDPFASLKAWFLDITGINYIVKVLSAPMNFIKIVAPQEIAYALGALWYGITLILFILVITGRTD